MSCNSFVSSSLGLSCKNNTAGLNRIYLFDTGNINILEGANGVSGFTATEPTNLFEWVLPRQTSSMTETITSSVENGTSFWTTTINVSLIGLSKTTQDQLKLLAYSTSTRAIVRDNSGNYYYVGHENGLDLTSSSSETGVNFGDRLGVSLELTHLGPTGFKNVDVADDTEFEALFTGTIPDNITLVKP